MALKRVVIETSLLCLLLYPVSLYCQTAVPATTPNATAEESGGVKLAAWHFEEFEIYFAVMLSLLCVTLFKMYYPKIPFVPEYIPQSLLLIVCGVIFGAIFNEVSHKELDETLWKLTPEMFFHFLLPPIVLEAAYSLYNRTFFDYLGSILIYAVIGTVLNFLIIGPMMYGLHRAGAMGPNMIPISFNSYLLFASLIVAVDPVAVLAIFQDIGVEPGLYYMVFGESLLNDAVTVVLYRIMSEFVGDPNVDGAKVGLGIGSFFTISFGGLLVGVIIGVITSFFTRWTGHFGAFLILLMSYFSYIMGETLGWSGIISMIGCGLVQADYAFHNISASSLTTVRTMIKEIAEIGESFIFFLIGVQLFSAEIQWNTGFCLWGLVACLVARTIVVFALTFIINWINLNSLRVTLRQQAILIYGGLRGAVAFSLGLLVDHKGLGIDGKDVRKIIVTATLFIIFFTVGLMGLTMKPLVKWFRIKLAVNEELSIFRDLNGNVIDHILAGLEAIVGSNGRNRTRVFFTRIDDRFIRHWLQRNPETHDERIVKTYETIALKLHYATIKPAKSSTYLAGLPESIRQKHLAGSGESALHLPSLVANYSDQRLYDYFSSQNAFDSSTSLAAQSSASVEEHGERRVNFDPSTKPDSDEVVVNPEWRRRTSLIDNGRHEEPFQNQFLGVMRSKVRAMRQLRHRRHRHHEELDLDGDDEKQRAEETAANTAINKEVTKPGRVDTSSTNLSSVNQGPLPPRDYPAFGSAEQPKFSIGDDE
ncbi:unnamed protein product [Mesocestoides corti]|uniref:Sodium/hydrogen exchanger n=2 Tax=Mesocestoides corti TaxID=53468 RepID=A0A0R3UCF6_MESCO|nr:unnamed protein product [Mesocestoides corti]